MKERRRTYRGSRVVSKPDGGELAPTELPLRDVPTSGERIADSDGVVASFAVGVGALVLFLRRRRRWTRHRFTSVWSPIWILSLRFGWFCELNKKNSSIFSRIWCGNLDGRIFLQRRRDCYDVWPSTQGWSPFHFSLLFLFSMPPF